MRQNRNELLRAVRYALAMGTAAAVGLYRRPGLRSRRRWRQGRNAGDDRRHRLPHSRVDLETSSPVFVIDKSAGREDRQLHHR